MARTHGDRWSPEPVDMTNVALTHSTPRGTHWTCWTGLRRRGRCKSRQPWLVARWMTKPLTCSSKRARVSHTALQLHGYEAWQASKGKDRIGVDVARRSIVTTRQGLDERLYGPTWRRCLPGEREYLAVVAWLLEQGDRVSGQKVAHKLGNNRSRHLGPAGPLNRPWSARGARRSASVRHPFYG